MRISKPNLDPNFGRPIIGKGPEPAIKDPGFSRPSFQPGGYGSLLPGRDRECVDPHYSRPSFGPPACAKPLPPMKGDHLIDPGFSRTLFGSSDSFAPSPQALELLGGGKENGKSQLHWTLFNELGW